MARLSRLYAGTTVLVTAAGLALLPAPAQAVPRRTAAQVRAQIKHLEAEAEHAKKQQAKARGALAALGRQQAAAAAELSRERAQLVVLRAKLAATADFAYRNGGLGSLADLASVAGPTTLMTAATLDQVATAQAAQLQAATRAEAEVDATRQRLAANAAATKKTIAELAATQRHAAALLARQHTLLRQLDPVSEALSQLARASRSSTRTAIPPVSAKRVAAVLRFAYAQLGKPYQYGAAGPGSYDCSGLTMRAWAQAGVSLPHNAAAQQSMVRRVTGPMEPGDLVFEGSPAYHVGIYVGNGRMLHAPETGDVVRIVPLPAYSSVGRP